MSSIVIAGDTSGSVTLQAPAVAGSTVLNLPSTSGTIQTSGAGYTTNGVAYATSTSALSTGSALTFDGSSLFVGATSAAAGKLVVKDTASSNTLWLVGRTSDGASSVSFRNAADSAYAGRIEVDPTSGMLIGTTGATTQLTLNTSGNLGLGVTPSTWSQGKAFEISAVGEGLWGNGLGDIWMLNGAYFNGGFKYSGTTKATAYRQGAGTSDGSHSWHIAGSGTAGNAITFTQAMTLDANGLLQVGATSPINSGAVTFASTGGTYNQLELCDTRAYSSTPNSSLGFAVKYNSAGSYTNMAAIVGTKENATDGNYSGALLFYTSLNGSGSAERARIDSSGNLLVGTTSLLASERLIAQNAQSGSWVQSINNTATSFTGTGARGLFIQYIATPNSTSNAFWDCYDNNGSTRRGGLMSNGGLANYSANNVNLSDRREKTNFAPAKSYLDVICSIPVQTYNYIDQNLEEDGDLTLGVVAQDVQAVAPELVMESNWGTEEEPKMRLSIYQTDLQYALMKCIQEQQALINTLTDRISVLENK